MPTRHLICGQHDGVSRADRPGLCEHGPAFQGFEVAHECALSISIPAPARRSVDLRNQSDAGLILRPWPATPNHQRRVATTRRNVTAEGRRQRMIRRNRTNSRVWIYSRVQADWRRAFAERAAS